MRGWVELGDRTVTVTIRGLYGDNGDRMVTVPDG